MQNMENVLENVLIRLLVALITSKILYWIWGKDDG